MNFYAHLVAASWQSRDPDFALGAMLPDFASMASVRLPVVREPERAAGIRFHHDSDRAFHRLPEFRSQERWTLQHMLQAGLRRGPARGVAHVGVELSLDGSLVGNRAADDLYLRAVERGRSHPPDFADPEASARFARLTERLAEFGVPRGYSEAQVVGERLIRILQPRPLLRLQIHELPILMDAVQPMHRRVLSESRAIMEALALAMSDEPDAKSGESSDRENPEAASLHWSRPPES